MNIRQIILLSCTSVLLFCEGCSHSQISKTIDDSVAIQKTPLTAINPPTKHPDIPNSGTSDIQAEAPAPTAPKLEQYLQSMTLEEKVAQLFIILPESLIDGIDCVTAAGDMTQKAFDEIPVGGFIYLRENLQSEEQVKAMLSGIQTFSRNRLNLPAFT